ncbi:GntR family transcriptional repressor for pyruvate dehydrogenase complex [Kribbella aluminosa]|uniref:GntR family transcriptional repressor for pyruvate dehydrogenase complex n=1 Tax=Kribbella aluminosa TaxID=416017 RepID=A0ABS4UWZ2_9ACTN|nr:FCD domain-containing protein [Kribbella aluminosa]MBP2356173.1 GntR family transcriptional repressor for pyruvate dehydrogenase complex [Kribbella aluminosa]
MSIERTTLSDHVAKGIVADIAERGLKAGDEIRAEGELAELYGVNKLVVREAIRTLVAREILVSSQGKRARVSTPSPAVFGQILAFRLGQRSMAMRDLIDTRIVVEGALAARAAERIADGSGDVKAIEKSLVDMREPGLTAEAFISFDLQFHDGIADLADASILSFILSAMQGVLLDTRRASYAGRRKRQAGVDRTIEEHQAILDAIAAGDPARATAAMTGHLSETGRDLGL